MRHYETIFIISPELNEEETEAVVEKFATILEDQGAFINKIDKWGRRRLAYRVKKFHKGFYVLLDYGAPIEAVAEMERNFKIDERVIRYLTVLKDKQFDLEAAKQAKAEAEAAKAAQAQEAARAKAEAEARAQAEAQAQEQAGESSSAPQEETSKQDEPAQGEQE